MNQQIKQSHIHQAKKLDLNHIKLLLLDKKYWIITIALFFIIIWIFIAPNLLLKQQMYDFQAVVRFEDQRIQARFGGVEDRITMMETESRTKIIKTTQFIKRVIDSLDLNIQITTPGVFRKDVFKSISTDPKLNYGNYTIIKKDDSKIDLLYSNKQKKIENKLIKTINTINQKTPAIEIPGLKAELFLNEFEYNEEISFSYLPDKNLIERIKKNINTNLNLQQTLFVINFSYNDPYLGAEITNSLVDIFFEHSLESKKSKTKSILNSLVEQVKLAKEELDLAEEALQAYREANPHVYLAQNTGEYSRNISSDRSELSDVKNDLYRLNGLIEERNNANGAQELALVYQEALRFLVEKNLAGISAIAQPYQNAMAEKDRLIASNYSETNPRIIEVNQQLSNLQRLIDTRVQEYLSELKAKENRLSSNIGMSELRLRQAPEKEIQLARFMRDREVKAQIYSDLLVRYNEVKIADASIVSDLELIQQAEVPIIEGGFSSGLSKILIYFFGMLLGVIFGAAIIVGYDFIWHSARSEKDIEALVNLPVLATIPVIKNQNKMPDEFAGEKRIDPKLVTIDYMPTLESESFRNLRTKLILNKDEEEKQQIVITSLMPNDGKSLVSSNLAITFAQLKKPTLLIDADMRRGVLHNSFLCDKKPGLSDLLAKEKNINSESIGKVIQKTTIPNLHLIPSGLSIPNPTEILIGEKIERLINHLVQQFHHIIIDTPPIDFIPDALVLNKVINNILIIVRYGVTDINRLKKRLNEYQSTRKNFNGIVINAAKSVSSKKYYNYSYYKY